MILFLFLSGKISEFEGLGWKAKFKNIGAESVIKAARTSDLATTSEQANPADFFNEAYWGFCRPYYLLTDGSAKSKEKPNELDKRAAVYIATAIRTSIVCGRFAALVIVDNDRKPVGFFPRDQFLELLRIVLVGYGDTPIDGEAAFKQIAGSELGVILMNPVIRAKSDEANHNTVPGTEDIESVYKKMIAADAKIALITDRSGRFDGIITRSTIEGRIIEGLLAASK
jgi:CBS domain-containing protein